MIDGIRLTSISGVLRQRIESSPLLAETLKYNTTVKTGETVTTANYNDLCFTILTSGRVVIKGSLHKYFNCLRNNFIRGQRHNANDFTIDDIQIVLNDLAEAFGPDILESKIDSLEFGLNIQTPCSASHFISQNITLLKFGPRLKNPIIENCIHGFKFGVKYIFCDYWLKVYDKGKQYNICTDLLRVEYKTTKMRAVKDANLRTLGDITDSRKLQVLFNNLIDLYNHLLIREHLNDAGLSKHDIKLVDGAFNPDYWNMLTPKLRDKKKGQFERLYRDHATTNLKGTVSELLVAKYLELMNIKSGDSFTGGKYTKLE